MQEGQAVSSRSPASVQVSTAAQHAQHSRTSACTTVLCAVAKLVREAGSRDTGERDLFFSTTTTLCTIAHSRERGSSCTKESGIERGETKAFKGRS
jgi:hypothetical protein